MVKVNVCCGWYWILCGIVQVWYCSKNPYPCGLTAVAAYIGLTCHWKSSKLLHWGRHILQTKVAYKSSNVMILGKINTRAMDRKIKHSSFQSSPFHLSGYFHCLFMVDVKLSENCSCLQQEIIQFRIMMRCINNMRGYISAVSGLMVICCWVEAIMILNAKNIAA